MKAIKTSTATYTLQPTPMPETVPVVLDAETLIRRAFSEEAKSGMAALFRHYYAPLCSHAVRFVASKAIAEDIVSDVLFEFHSQGRHTAITTSFRAYLFRSVRHRAFDYVQAELRRSGSLDGAAHLAIDATQQPDALAQYDELYQDLQRAINALPLKRRETYLLHRFEGKKYQEIADELGLSPRTVEAHLYQAMRQIREALRDKWLVLALMISVGLTI